MFYSYTLGFWSHVQNLFGPCMYSPMVYMMINQFVQRILDAYRLQSMLTRFIHMIKFQCTRECVYPNLQDYTLVG